jgi:hypothetical protein
MSEYLLDSKLTASAVPLLLCSELLQCSAAHLPPSRLYGCQATRTLTTEILRLLNFHLPIQLSLFSLSPSPIRVWDSTFLQIQLLHLWQVKKHDFGCSTLVHPRVSRSTTRVECLSLWIASRAVHIRVVEAGFRSQARWPKHSEILGLVLAWSWSLPRLRWCTHYSSRYAASPFCEV